MIAWVARALIAAGLLAAGGAALERYSTHAFAAGAQRVDAVVAQGSARYGDGKTLPAGPGVPDGPAHVLVGATEARLDNDRQLWAPFWRWVEWAGALLFLGIWGPDSAYILSF